MQTVFFDNGGTTTRLSKERRRRIRKFLLERDGPNCWICFTPFEGNQSISIDHIIPRTLGGTNDIRNLALAHPLCNNRRPLLRFALKEWSEKERTI